MKILLVNDDGYQFANILALEEILKEYGEVFVVAPSNGMSGAGCGLTTFKDIRFYQIDDHHWHVDGTPVDCVQFADYLIGDVDVVVSGVNAGWNLSNDIMYSGTCGAAFQTLMFRRKAIALSASKKEDVNKVKHYARVALDYIFSRDLLSNEYYLNVNFPLHTYEKEKGILLTRLFIRRSTYTLEVIDENDRLFHLRRHHNDEEVFDDNSYDVSAIHNGYISITPMGVSTYRDEYLDDLKKRNNK